MKEDDVVFNVEIKVCISNKKLCIFCIQQIHDDQVPSPSERSKQNSAIYLPHFYSLINHNLNATCFSVIEHRFQPVQQVGSKCVPPSVSSKAIPVPTAAPCSQTQRVLLEQLLKSVQNS